MLDPKINTLLKVSETGNFTKAAEVLSLTQPAVSQHIRQLEKELGAKLFNRGEKGVMLTREGEIAVKYSRRIAALYDKLTAEVGSQKNRPPMLKIGVTHTSESNRVVEAFASYCSKNDNVHIKVVTDTITNLYDMLDNFEIDMAVVERLRTDDKYRSLLLDTDALVLVVSPQNRLAGKNMVKLGWLKDQKMILRLPSSGTRNLFINHLEKHGMAIKDFNVILEVDNIATIKELVRQDFGVSVLAKSACDAELSAGTLIALPVEDLSMVRNVNLVYHRDFEHGDILAEIIKIYNQTASLYA